MKRIFPRWQTSLLIAITFVISVQATAQLNPDEKLPLDPKVKIGRLPNGLTYYIRHNSLPEKRVELRLVVNAGSVFLGNFSCESAGDYASGTNHTLPTNGYAKAYSGVSLDSFVKKITYQKLSKEGINNIGPAIELMAEAEGLQAHKNAVTVRLSKK